MGHWSLAASGFLTRGIPGALYTALLVPVLFYAVPRIVRGRA